MAGWSAVGTIVFVNTVVVAIGSALGRQPNHTNENANSFRKQFDVSSSKFPVSKIYSCATAFM
eukprot:592191-Amphidinium_carterae.1